MDNHPNILRGEPLERLIDMSLGELLIMTLNVHDENIILVSINSYFYRKVSKVVIVHQNI